MSGSWLGRESIVRIRGCTGVRTEIVKSSPKREIEVFRKIFLLLIPDSFPVFLFGAVLRWSEPVAVGPPDRIRLLAQWMKRARRRRHRRVSSHP